MACFYDEKLVISGKFVERYLYSKPFCYGYEVRKFGRKVKLLKRTKTSKLKSRSKIRALVNANEQLKTFLTLTFARNVQDLTEANYEFKKFIERAKYNFGAFSYVCVVEFQKRGAVHYHIVWSLDYVPIRELEALWAQGFVWLTRCRNIRNIGAYFAKHGSKGENDPIESVKLSGRKKFFCSRGLNRPLIIRDKNEIANFMAWNLLNVKPFFAKHSEYEDLSFDYEQYKLDESYIKKDHREKWDF